MLQNLENIRPYSFILSLYICSESSKNVTGRLYVRVNNSVAHISHTSKYMSDNNQYNEKLSIFSKKIMFGGLGGIIFCGTKSYLWLFMGSP